MIKNEVWKPVFVYGSKYEISNRGRIRNKKTNRLKKPTIKDNHFVICLCDSGISRVFKVHNLLYITFVGDIPEGYEIHHKDFDSLNNELDNLVMLTAEEHKKIHELSEKSILAFTKNGIFVKEFSSIANAKRWIGKKSAAFNICSCLKGRIPSAYGYIWQYKH